MPPAAASVSATLLLLQAATLPAHAAAHPLSPGEAPRGPHLLASGLAVPCLLGVNTHYLEELPGETRWLRAQGFQLVRTDLRWGAVEVRAGSYNWTGYDALLATLSHNALLAPLLTMSTSNALYDGGDAPTSPAAVAAYTRFVVAAATRYAGLGVLWELSNEPNIPVCSGEAARGGGGAGAAGAATARAPPSVRRGMGDWRPCASAAAYGALAVSVGTALKATLPAEVFVGPATSQRAGSDELDVDFLSTVFAAGALVYFDAVSQHLYRPTGPEDADAEIAQLRALIDAHAPAGKAIPILSGEWGWSTASIKPDGAPLADETTQAKYLGRSFLNNIRNGVNLSIFYDWRDDCDNATDIECRFGTVRGEYQNASLPYLQKPAARAAIAVQRGLSPCSYVGSLTLAIGDVSCFAVYLDCGFITPGFATWCAAPDGWSTMLTFPYDFAPGAPLGGGAAAAAAPAPNGPCFRSANFLGEVTGLPCSTGDPPMWTLQVDNGITYLRDVW